MPKCSPGRAAYPRVLSPGVHVCGGWAAWWRRHRRVNSVGVVFTCAASDGVVLRGLQDPVSDRPIKLCWVFFRVQYRLVVSCGKKPRGGPLKMTGTIKVCLMARWPQSVTLGTPFRTLLRGRIATPARTSTPPDYIYMCVSTVWLVRVGPVSVWPRPCGRKLA